MKGFILTTILVFFVSASLPAALPRGGAVKRSSIAPPVTTKAVISGLEKGAFQSLPPVLIELSDLPSSAAVWVEVVKGQLQNRPRIGTTVESKFYLRRGGVGVLSVPGIHKACCAGGVYTLIVKMSDHRGTVRLSQRSFELFPQRVVSR